MIRLALGVLCGALWFHQLPGIPAWPWAFAALVIGVGGALRRAPGIAGCGFSLAWTHVYLNKQGLHYTGSAAFIHTSAADFQREIFSTRTKSGANPLSWASWLELTKC